MTLKSTTVILSIFTLAAGDIISLDSYKHKSTEDRDIPDLVVEPGEIKTLSARTYNYSNIIIKQGGILQIQPGSNKWTILWVENNVTINGKIVARKFIFGSRTVSDKTPDGKQIDHTYMNAALGGTGGNGGNSRFAGHGRQGGIGADGTNQYGGGGGSGAGIIEAGSRTRIGGNGNDAIGWRGGPMGQAGLSPGGNGGKLPSKCNGGLIFIMAKNSFDGNGGEVDLGGEDGVDGESINKCQTRGYNEGPSGGGGGSPGGEGGHLLIVSSNFVSYPQVNVLGGRGGSGGDVKCATLEGATNGSEGEYGETGLVDFMTMDQW